MKTFYIDHNILVREDNWPELSRLLTRTNGSRLVISDWNLLEILGADNKAQAIRRTEFLENLKPLWIMDRRYIQQHEVKRFIWLHYFNCPAEQFCVFTEHFSVMLSHHLGSKVPLGWTVKRWIEYSHGRMDLEEIKSAEAEYANALKTLQNADKKQKRDLDHDMFCAWVLISIPDRDQENKLISNSKKEEIVRFCYTEKDEFYSNCPAMAVEHELKEIRTQNRKRQPKEQDACDLQHSVVALAYCDVFITKDRYVFDCAKRAVKALKRFKTASIHDSIPNCFNT